VTQHMWDEPDSDQHAFIIGRCAECGKIQGAWQDKGSGRAKIIYDMVQAGLKVEKVYATHVQLEGECDHE